MEDAGHRSPEGRTSCQLSSTPTCSSPATRSPLWRHDDFDRAGVAGADGEGLLDVGETVMPGDQGIEVNPSRRRQGDGVWPGVGVPERAGHLELTGLDMGQRERDLLAAHPDEDYPPGPAHRPDRRADGS